MEMERATIQATVSNMKALQPDRDMGMVTEAAMGEVATVIIDAMYTLWYK